MDTTIPYGDSDYFHTLVEAMVGAGGIQNVSIRGSPYDFRFAPSSAYSGSWLQKITHLVEETYALNNNSSVILLSHSMGCLYTLWFLNQKNQEWKDKYINKWIPTAGVFGGAGTGIKQVSTFFFLLCRSCNYHKTKNKHSVLALLFLNNYKTISH